METGDWKFLRRGGSTMGVGRLFKTRLLCSAETGSYPTLTQSEDLATDKFPISYCVMIWGWGIGGRGLMRS